MTSQLIVGDCRTVLATLPNASVDCCVTSPPYFGLRDYGHEGQIGLEQTPDEYVQQMVAVFREVRRVLRDDGTLWLNLGDSYAGYWGDAKAQTEGRPSSADTNGWTNGFAMNKRPKFHDAFRGTGIKPKDLVGIPWRVALALQADGWYLRQDIIWHKPNPMPESVTDRCTKAHEYIFLLSKSERYYYDAASIAEPAAPSSVARLSQPTLASQEGSDRVPGKTNGTMKAVGNVETRNRRSVWTVTTKPFSGAHFATFPPDLIMPCILAGCRPGGTVLDPFNGAGTTGLVSLTNGRQYIGIELNPEYATMSMERFGVFQSLVSLVSQDGGELERMGPKARKR